jgi:hypothetical protein
MLRVICNILRTLFFFCLLNSLRLFKGSFADREGGNKTADIPDVFILWPTWHINFCNVINADSFILTSQTTYKSMPFRTAFPHIIFTFSIFYIWFLSFYIRNSIRIIRSFSFYVFPRIALNDLFWFVLRAKCGAHRNTQVSLAFWQL